LSPRLFVDNLPPQVTEDALRAIFSEEGRIVITVAIMSDRRTGDSHGYAFIEMASAAHAVHAISALHGRLWGGLKLHVSEARPRASSREGA
jgi:RNA recognition motif-containing protein